MGLVLTRLSGTGAGFDRPRLACQAPIPASRLSDLVRHKAQVRASLPPPLGRAGLSSWLPPGLGVNQSREL